MFKDKYSVRNHLTKLFMQRYERYLPTAFDESMSLLEKMNKLIEAQNSLIDVVNSHTEFTSEQLERAFGIIDENLANQLKQFRDELEEQKIQYEEIRDKIHSDILPDSVKQKLEEWLLNGTIEELINDVVFTDINEKLEIVENRLVEYDSRDRVIYVNGDSGSDSGFGEIDTPFKTMNKAFNYLKSLSDKGSEGQWTIRVSGKIVDGTRVMELPNLREPLKIEGDLTPSGDPNTIFDGVDSNSVNGLWFEPAGNHSIVISNVVFVNWESYAVIMKDKGKLNVENCHFTDCYFGVGSINQNRTTIHNSVFTRCQTGVVTQYSSTLTVGYTQNPEEYRNTFIECRYAVSIDRNSVAHVDYNTIRKSTLSGVIVNENSRVNCTGNTFVENNQGVRVQGGGEWLNNNNTFIDSVEFDYQHFGTGKETRLYSQRTNIDYRTPMYQPTNTDFSGNSEGTNQLIATLPSTTFIPQDFFRGDGKKIKVTVYGQVLSNPDSSTATISIDALSLQGGGSYNMGYATVEGVSGSFIYELEVTNIATGGQFTKNHIDSNRRNPVIATATKNIPTDTERRIRLYIRSEDNNMVVRINHIEFTQAG